MSFRSLRLSALMAGAGALCEGALSARWKSVRELVAAPKLNVTASPRGEVESNGRRTGSP